MSTSGLYRASVCVCVCVCVFVCDGVCVCNSLCVYYNEKNQRSDCSVNSIIIQVTSAGVQLDVPKTRNTTTSYFDVKSDTLRGSRTTYRCQQSSVLPTSRPQLGRPRWPSDIGRPSLWRERIDLIRPFRRWFRSS